MTIQEFAEEYQDMTGCTDEEAVKAAFAAGYLLSVIAENTDAEKHFRDRYNEYRQQS